LAADVLNVTLLENYLLPVRATGWWCNWRWVNLNLRLWTKGSNAYSSGFVDSVYHFLLGSSLVIRNISKTELSLDSVFLTNKTITNKNIDYENLINLSPLVLQSFYFLLRYE
jgi:hypothetical protein